MKQNKYRLFDIIAVIVFLILLFQIPLQNKFTIFQYADEVIPISLFVFAILNIFIKKKIEKDTLQIGVLMAVFLLLGLLGNMFFYRIKLNAIIQDIVISFKFLFLSLGLVECGLYTSSRCKHLVSNFCKLCTIIFLVLVILNLILHIYPINEIRFGFQSQELFFLHPTYFAAALNCLIIALLLCDKTKYKFIYIFILSVLVISTLRIKAIASILVLWCLIIFKVFGKKIKKRYIVFIGIIALFLAWYQIQFYYFNNDGFARTALLKNSFLLAKDHFPIGTGFATFGSWTSGEFYSPVYYDYHLNEIWGLMPKMHSFIADTFWPAVLGQFGIMGLMIFCILLYKLYIYFKKRFSRKYEYILLYVFLYMLISSSAESAFFNPLSICLFYSLLIFRK